MNFKENMMAARKSVIPSWSGCKQDKYFKVNLNDVTKAYKKGKFVPFTIYHIILLLKNSFL